MPTGIAPCMSPATRPAGLLTALCPRATLLALQPRPSMWGTASHVTVVPPRREHSKAPPACHRHTLQQRRQRRQRHQQRLRGTDGSDAGCVHKLPRQERQGQQEKQQQMPRHPRRIGETRPPPSFAERSSRPLAWSFARSRTHFSCVPAPHLQHHQPAVVGGQPGGGGGAGGRALEREQRGRGAGAGGRAALLGHQRASAVRVLCGLQVLLLLRGRRVCGILNASDVCAGIMHCCWCCLA